MLHLDLRLFRLYFNFLELKLLLETRLLLKASDSGLLRTQDQFVSVCFENDLISDTISASFVFLCFYFDVKLFANEFLDIYDLNHVLSDV